MAIHFKRYFISMCFILSLSITCLVQAADRKSFDELKDKLWRKYLIDVQSLTVLKSEYDNRTLLYKDKIMHFSLEKRGDEPQDGYPLYIALHGGGQTSSNTNDSQWKAMKVYYRDSIQNGIYVAPRGITNNWKLHFEDESYPLYDKLIESAILFDHVNPNRVYLLGFSAGGDGVYQIIPRMPERFAAANMSAGHNNWITFDNIHNTPFLIQVGEFDTVCNRNEISAVNYVIMNQLRKYYGSGFAHDLFMHYGGMHNRWRDNDSSRKDQTIINDPEAWLSGNRDTKLVNTNAIDWLNQYTREAAPEKLVWDLRIGANERIYQTGANLVGKIDYDVKKLAKPKDLFYWLDISVMETIPNEGKLVVRMIKDSNTIQVDEVKGINKFRILLNPNLLDLSKPITIKIANQLITNIMVKETAQTMVRTLLERSDQNEIYDAELILAYNNPTEKWEIVVG